MNVEPVRAGRALLALSRVELRQFARHPGRALLIALLVLVPVAAIVGGGSLLRMIEPTPEERMTHAMGAAALAVETDGDHVELGRVQALLPRDARVARLFQGAEDARGPGRRLRARGLAGAPGTFDADGLAAGLVQLTRGRFPAHSGEVALSPALMKGLGAALGDSVTLAYGPRRVVCGVVIDTEALDQALVVRTAARVESRGAHRLLVQVPPDSVAVVAARLRGAGLGVALRTDAAAGDPAALALIGLVGGIGLLEAALVVAAAFAVSLRRRQHEIGLLGSVGASPGAIRAALLVSTGVLAAAGALAGAVVGLGAAATLQPFLDGWNRRANGGFEVAWAYVVGGVALGILTALLAAALPTRQAARLPIRQALGGRRPAQQPARIWLQIGLGMLGVGLALLLLLPRTRPGLTLLSLLGGSVLGLLGFGALSPWLLEGLARRAAGLPLALRLAVRDAGRFRARNGPVVTAVLAGMATSVTVAALVASVESTLGALPARYRADQLWIEGPAAEELARRIGREEAAVALAPLSAAYLRGQPVLARFDTSAAGRGPAAWVALGDEALLQAIGLEAAAPEFKAGQLLAIDAPAGAREAELTVGREPRVIRRVEVHGVVSAERVEGPRFFLARASYAAEEWEAGPPPRRTLFPWIVRLKQPVSAQVLARAQALAAPETGTTVDAARLHRGPTRTLYHVLLGLCLLTGLVVVLLATALSAAESEEDMRTLHTVGASPALLRAQRATRAGYLAFLGCALAVPAGLIPAVGLLKETNIGLGFVLPWRDLLIVLCGLPGLAAGIAWCTGPVGGAAAAGGRAGRVLLVVLWLSLMASDGAATAGPVAGPAAKPAPPRAAAPAVLWEPWVGRAVDGSPLPGELGRIRVPENRRTGGGATLELAFVRYHTTNPHPGPPIIFLEGGPGGSGVEGCAFVATHPLLRLLEQCDVIGLDQRGTGLSRPNLGEPDFTYALPLDREATRAAELGAFQGAARRAVAYWSARGVDLAAYNTVESADDVDDLRAALGLERVVIYGSSYGSHLGLAYLRRHAEHVARAVLVKVEGPDQTWKRPTTTQRQLELIHARASADAEVGRALPDFLGAVRTLLRRLERAPVTVALPPAADSARGAPDGVDSLMVTVGSYDLRCALARALASTRGCAGLADFVYQCTRGNWTPLAERALVERRGSLGSAMALMMDCASGATADRRRRLAAERADPANLLGDALDAPFYPETCAACGNPDLGDAFRAPFNCAVPVLFVSGELDARTPPDNVQEIRAGFSRSTHIRVTNAGHDSRELISEEYRGLLQAFLRGESVPDCTLELPFRFEPIRPTPAVVAATR